MAATKTRWALQQAAKGELDQALEMFCKKKPPPKGALPVVSATSPVFRLEEDMEGRDDNGSLPSMDELLSRIENDELLQLEKEDQEVLEASRDMREISRRGGPAEPKSRTRAMQNGEVEDLDGLPVRSAGKRPAGDASSQAQETEQALVVVPAMDDILARIDFEELGHVHGELAVEDAMSSEMRDAINLRCESENRLREAAQVHPDRARGSFETFVGSASSVPVAIRVEHALEARDLHEAGFKDAEAEIGWDWMAGDITRRKPDPKGISDNKPKESDSEEEEEDWPEAGASVLGDMLRSMKSKPVKKNKKSEAAILEKKPASQRTESLPGVRMPGAKKAVAKPGSKSAPLKKGGPLDRRLRLANAGGSLATLFEDKADEEGEAPDVECILAGRPLRCAETLQAFSCVVDCFRDDWKQSA